MKICIPSDVVANTGTSVGIRVDPRDLPEVRASSHAATFYGAGKMGTAISVYRVGTRFFCEGVIVPNAREQLCNWGKQIITWVQESRPDVI